MGDSVLAYPKELKYVKSHEYVKVEGDTAVVGITAFAADQLGDVTFVELPSVGTKLGLHDKFGVIESVKSVSDLFSPVSGEVVAINDELTSQPELVNLDCYGKGWMIKIKMADTKELDQTMSSEDYKGIIG